MRITSPKTRGRRMGVRLAVASWALPLVTALAIQAHAGQPASLSGEADGGGSTAAADTAKKAVTKSATTAAKKPATPAKAPSVAKSAPTSTKAPATVAKAPATVAKTAPAVAKAPAKTAPAVGKAPATVAKTAPAVAKAPATVAKTAPAVAKTAPTIAKTTPSVSKLAPTVTKPAPSVANSAVKPAPAIARIPAGTTSPGGAPGSARVSAAALKPTPVRTGPAQSSSGPALATRGGTTVQAPAPGRGSGTAKLAAGAIAGAAGSAPQNGSPAPAPSVSKSSAVAAAAAREDHITYQYNALGRRDPFQSLIEGEYVGADVGGQAAPDLGGLKVVGIVWGTNDQFAMVEDVRGNSYVLRRGDQVMNGYVEGLKRDAMIVNITVDGQSQSVSIPLTRKGEKSNANR